VHEPFSSENADPPLKRPKDVQSMQPSVQNGMAVHGPHLTTVIMYVVITAVVCAIVRAFSNSHIHNRSNESLMSSLELCKKSGDHNFEYRDETNTSTERIFHRTVDTMLRLLSLETHRNYVAEATYTRQIRMVCGGTTRTNHMATHNKKMAAHHAEADTNGDGRLCGHELEQFDLLALTEDTTAFSTRAGCRAQADKKGTTTLHGQSGGDKCISTDEILTYVNCRKGQHSQ
jgi:hypothetical protein